MAVGRGGMHEIVVNEKYSYFNTNIFTVKLVLLTAIDILQEYWV